MITLDEICEAVAEYHGRTGILPTRVTFGPRTWKQLRDKVLEFQNGQPFKLFGMDIAVQDYVDGFELSDEQPLRFTRYFLKEEWENQDANRT